MKAGSQTLFVGTAAAAAVGETPYLLPSCGDVRVVTESVTSDGDLVLAAVGGSEAEVG